VRLAKAELVGGLREQVVALRGCLGELGKRDRRLLTLRAGLDGRGERSASEVAEVLGIPERRFKGFERRALRRLVSRCGSVTVVGATDSSVASLPPLEPAILVGNRKLVPKEELDQGDVAGVQASGGGGSERSARDDGGGGVSRAPQFSTVGAPASEGWSAPLLPLFMLIAASAAGVVALVVVRLRQTLPHGDTGFTRGSSLGQVAPDVSPGDKTGVQGPPATEVAASAPVESAGGLVRTSRTGPSAPSSTGVRRSGGLIGAASPRARRAIQRFTERRRGK
jgi:hypothetical protein